MASNCGSSRPGTTWATAKSSEPSRRRASIQGSTASLNCTSTAGSRPWKSLNAAGRMVCANEVLTASATRPVSPSRICAISSRARCMSASSMRARGAKASPKGVSRTPLTLRSTSGASTSRSSSRTILVTAGCEMPSTRAAARMLICSTTATKACNWLGFMEDGCRTGDNQKLSYWPNYCLFSEQPTL